jgi:hypothetical protein
LLIAAQGGEKLIGNANAIPIMALCIVAMLCALGQYYAGYFNALSIQDRLKNSGQTEFEYDETAPLYIWRMRLFYAKAVLSTVAAIWLVVVLAVKII